MRSVFFAHILTFMLICRLDLTSSTCGYESCPQTKEGYLNIHLVPHSHDDVGWLKTVEQYFYGAKNSIQQAAVQYTLDSVVEELQKDKSRRFIYVETGFFWRWWTNRDEKTKQIVRNLVDSGQLEFINGGWCMNDEATTHYNEIVDQMSLGLRFLNDTFGICGLPRVAWQIDPFGHSREQASLFAQMGFDGLFFGRLDYQDKFYRRIEKNMETIWSGSPNNLGKNAWLFTGALFNGYNPPDGFCFDVICGDDPIMDDPKLLDYNVDKKVEEFIKISQYWATPYRTSNVLMTMGSDFQYMAARMWYQNLDKLIKYVNARQSTGSKVNLLYSTPSCYLQEVHKANLTWSMKKDDFFPYASDPHAFWTGYFTSRPALKYFVHKTNNFLQACKHLSAFTSPTAEKIENVGKLSEPLAVAQHHDAVAGTAKQHVTNDYSRRLSIGISACEEVISSAFWEMTEQIMLNSTEDNDIEKSDEEYFKGPQQNIDDLPFQFCHELNISSCTASEALSNFVLSVYNPLSRARTNAYIRLPVPTPLWKVQGPEGQLNVQSVVIPKSVFKIPGRESSSLYEIVIPTGTLLPLSVTNFVFNRVQNNAVLRDSDIASLQRVKSRKDLEFINSKGVGFVLDCETGLVKRIIQFNKATNQNTSVPLKQNFYYYKGMTGDNEKAENRASGAYIFRPNGSIPIPISSRASYSVYRGEHVTEVHQTFTEWVSQVVRLYENADSVEFEWQIGPIPINDGFGKEIVTKYTSDLKSEGVFYTDANGREILKRVRDFRPTWHYKVYEPVSGNYYPVNSRMLLSESETDLTKSTANAGKTLILLNDRAQGGTSMLDGEMELMVHRRLLADDAFGVGEALNEQAFGTGLVVRGKHWLVLAGRETGVPISIHRPLAQEIFMDGIYAFSSRSRMPIFRESGDLVPKFIPQYGKTLGEVLSDNVHLLTFERISSHELLVRFEHFYEVGEDEVMSKPAFISVQKLREAIKFVDIRETTLGGNQWKSESARFEWNVEQRENRLSPKRKNHAHLLNNKSSQSKSYQEGDENITLNPMEIKTFILTV